MLEGVESNRDALGARIRVRIEEGGAERDIYRWVWPSGSFGSSSTQQEIGLGQATRIVFLEVCWPATDTIQSFADVEPDAFYRITEFDDDLRKLSRKRISLSGTATR